MTVKLIVTDMDETFLRKDKTYDKEKARVVFQALAKQGVIFAVASGNYIPLLESYFDEDILEHIYLAGDDGNMLKNHQEVLRTVPLDRRQAREIFHYLNKKEGYYPILSTGKQAYMKGPIPDDVMAEISIYYKGVNQIEAFEEIPEDVKIMKVETYCTNRLDDIKAVMEDIEAAYPGVSSVTSGEGWLDVYDENGGKGEAVKFLQKRYGIRDEETICFGDSLNDRSMMKEAHYSIAMENADADLKAYCNYEIGTSSEQAVLEVLAQYLEEGDLEFLERYRCS